MARARRGDSRPEFAAAASGGIWAERARRSERTPGPDPARALARGAAQAFRRRASPWGSRLAAVGLAAAAIVKRQWRRRRALRRRAHRSGAASRAPGAAAAAARRRGRCPASATRRSGRSGERRQGGAQRRRRRVRRADHRRAAGARRASGRRARPAPRREIALRPAAAHRRGRRAARRSLRAAGRRLGAGCGRARRASRIMVGGLGLNAEGTANAIARLPGAVSLGFAPYGGELEREAAEAREAGHEILLQAPMESFAYPADNPGPHTLLAAASDSRKPRLAALADGALSRLRRRRQLSRRKIHRRRARPDAGARPRSPRAASSISTTARRRAASRARSPRRLDLPSGTADVVIDANPAPEAIEAALTRLEALARRQGGAIGVAAALPASVERIARWSAGAGGARRRARSGLGDDGARRPAQRRRPSP